MTKQLQAATIRALYGSILTAGLTILTTYQMAGPIGTDRWETSFVAGGVAFFGYMLARGAVEGIIDSNRGPTSADVGQPIRS